MENTVIIEMMRWGFVSVPGVLFFYAKELDLDVEDIGILTAILYALEKTKPLFQTNIKAGQVLQACPFLTRQKLAKRLNRLHCRKIIDFDNNSNFVDKGIILQPMMQRLTEMVLRDHREIVNTQQPSTKKTVEQLEELLKQSKQRIEELERGHQEKIQEIPELKTVGQINGFKKLADFISKRTGSLLSVSMSSELKRWLSDYALTPDFLLCMLELCFERNITNPRLISRIARDMKEYSINNVEGLESYFKSQVDQEKSNVYNNSRFDPDVIDFGNYTGIDMSAEARKKVYYKWRYDWGFSHAMIMKAGEVMCQRTRNGGLEYIDSVLNDWMSKEIRQIEQAEKEVKEFKGRSKNAKPISNPSTPNKPKTIDSDYEIYVPKDRMELNTKI